jgi:hypothetical protein
MSTTMISEPLIYSRRLVSGLRTQKRERETLTLEKRSAKRGGLTFSSACSASPAPRSRATSNFRRQPRQERREGFDPGRRSGFSSPRRVRDPRRPLGLQGARGDSGAALGWAAGAGAAGHVAAPELPWAGQRELEPQDTWRPWSCPGLGSGSWSRRTRGGPGAALGWAVGAAGHVVAPELPRTCTRGYLVCRVPTADRADVPDREIGKILPIGKMIVLFIFRSNFQ